MRVTWVYINMKAITFIHLFEDPRDKKRSILAA